MEKFEYDEEIKSIINNDCKKIMKEIIELYENNIEVNKSFNELVKERINSKYIYMLEDYYINIIKLIPSNLYICPNNKWALVDEEKFNEIIMESLANDTNNKNITNTIKSIVKELTENSNIDFFNTINKHIEPLYKEEIDKKKSKYILDSIYYEVQKKGYTIKSIIPFQIEKN